MGNGLFQATVTVLYQIKEHFTDPQDTRKWRLHDQKDRDRSVKSLIDPDFVPCSALNTHVVKVSTLPASGLVQTWI